MERMILRQQMERTTSLLSFLTIITIVLPYLDTVHAGYAFLANQADCKLDCLNGGVCAFDTEHSGIHKCICFIGLFEGEQCEIQVTNDASPSTQQQSEEEEEGDEEEEGEEHQIQADDHQEEVEEEHQPQEHNKPDQQQEEQEDQQVNEFPEANADYETELSVAEPQEEVVKHEEEGELVTLDTTTQHMDIVSEEDKFGDQDTPKVPLHNIHLGENSNFVDLPTNPRGIKQYENTRARNNPHSEDPVATAWEYRPRKAGSSRAQQQQQENTPTAQKPAERQQRRKKKPVKKQEEGEESTLGGGWMMSKKGGNKGGSSGACLSTLPTGLGTTLILLLLLTNLRLQLL